MAMHADHCFARLKFAYGIVQVADQLPELIRHSPAHGIRNIDGGRARSDSSLADLCKKLRFGARSVLGRELDVVHIRSGPLHTFNREADNFLLRFAKLELAMDLRGC